MTNATTSYGHTGDNALCWSAAGAVTGTCSSPPAGATTYSFDNAGYLTSTSTGLSASYNLQNQNSQLTPPGGQPFDMSYVDATSDLRTQVGGLRMSYDLLGLNTQGTNSGVPHSDWFFRDPSGTLVARRGGRAATALDDCAGPGGGVQQESTATRRDSDGCGWTPRDGDLRG